MSKKTKDIKESLDIKKEKKSPIIPLGDRVVIEVLDKKDQSMTSSGIIIPESASDDHATKKGRVIAVGEGKFLDGQIIPPKVKIGDVVLYSWGDIVSIGGQKYTIVSYDNVTAIINN